MENFGKITKFLDEHAGDVYCMNAVASIMVDNDHEHIVSFLYDYSREDNAFKRPLPECLSSLIDFIKGYDSSIEIIITSEPSWSRRAPKQSV